MPGNLARGHRGAQCSVAPVSQWQKEVNVCLHVHMMNVMMSLDERIPRLRFQEPELTRMVDRIVNTHEQVADNDQGHSNTCHEQLTLGKEPCRRENQGQADHHVKGEVSCL